MALLNKNEKKGGEPVCFPLAVWEKVMLEITDEARNEITRMVTEADKKMAVRVYHSSCG
jgi:hypothetical protein